MANEVTSGMSKARDGVKLKITLVDGDAAATNIPIAGIATEDEILFVGHFGTKASIGTLVGLTSEASVTSAGNIQLSTTSTANGLLLIIWDDLSA